jgi:hypothetical protein
MKVECSSFAGLLSCEGSGCLVVLGGTRYAAVTDMYGQDERRNCLVLIGIPR